jgi:hypothetical protein
MFVARSVGSVNVSHRQSQVGAPCRTIAGCAALRCLRTYRGFRFPPEVIEHAAWLYHCFTLSLREVELILAARGIVFSYESIREWGLRFGRILANMLKRNRPVSSQIDGALGLQRWNSQVFRAQGALLPSWSLASDPVCRSCWCPAAPATGR